MDLEQKDTIGTRSLSNEGSASMCLQRAQLDPGNRSTSDVTSCQNQVHIVWTLRGALI